MLGQIRLFDNDDETQTGKQGKSQASLISCRVLPAIRPCWNLQAWKKKELGGLASCPVSAPLDGLPTSRRAGDGHSELGEAWLRQQILRVCGKEAS